MGAQAGSILWLSKPVGARRGFTADEMKAPFKKLLEKAPFKKLLEQVLSDQTILLGCEDKRFSPEAVKLLQLEAESFVSQRMGEAHAGQEHAKRKTVRSEDLAVTSRIRDGSLR